VIKIKLYEGININKLQLLGSGTQGKVYKINSNQCIKIFKKKQVCKDELSTLLMAQTNPHFPKLYSYGERHIIREYIDGIELDKYLLSNPLTSDISNKISKAQLNWLQEKTSNCNKNKLLFVHSPAFPTGAHLGHCLDLYPSARDDFLRTVEKCNINIIFSGHEHNYSRRIINNTFDNGYIYQVITGGAGEKLRDKYKSKEGVVVSPIAVYHFLVVDVEIDYIKVAAITSKGKKIDEFKINKST
jgi:hypothetical protein